jgi:hypothetical protein
MTTDHDHDDEAMQEWRPPRGPLTRLVALLIVAMIVVGTIVMLVVAIQSM